MRETIPAEPLGIVSGSIFSDVVEVVKNPNKRAAVLGIPLTLITSDAVANALEDRTLSVNPNDVPTPVEKTAQGLLEHKPRVEIDYSSPLPSETEQVEPVLPAAQKAVAIRIGRPLTETVPVTQTVPAHRPETPLFTPSDKEPLFDSEKLEKPKRGAGLAAPLLFDQDASQSGEVPPVARGQETSGAQRVLTDKQIKEGRGLLFASDRDPQRPSVRILTWQGEYRPFPDSPGFSERKRGAGLQSLLPQNGEGGSVSPPPARGLGDGPASEDAGVQPPVPPGEGGAPVVVQSGGGLSQEQIRAGRALLFANDPNPQAPEVRVMYGSGASRPIVTHLNPGGNLGFGYRPGPYQGPPVVVQPFAPKELPLAGAEANSSQELRPLDIACWEGFNLPPELKALNERVASGQASLDEIGRFNNLVRKTDEFIGRFSQENKGASVLFNPETDSWEAIDREGKPVMTVLNSQVYKWLEAHPTPQEQEEEVPPTPDTLPEVGAEPAAVVAVKDINDIEVGDTVSIGAGAMMRNSDNPALETADFTTEQIEGEVIEKKEGGFIVVKVINEDGSETINAYWADGPSDQTLVSILETEDSAAGQTPAEQPAGDEGAAAGVEERENLEVIGQDWARASLEATTSAYGQQYDLPGKEEWLVPAAGYLAYIRPGHRDVVLQVKHIIGWDLPGRWIASGNRTPETSNGTMEIYFDPDYVNLIHQVFDVAVNDSGGSLSDMEVLQVITALTVKEAYAARDFYGEKGKNNTEGGRITYEYAAQTIEDLKVAGLIDSLRADKIAQKLRELDEKWLGD